jgi:hypothetical protein
MMLYGSGYGIESFKVRLPDAFMPPIDGYPFIFYIAEIIFIPNRIMSCIKISAWFNIKRVFLFPGCLPPFFSKSKVRQNGQPSPPATLYNLTTTNTNSDTFHRTTIKNFAMKFK